MEDRRNRRYSVWDGAGRELSLNRYQQFVHQARVCHAEKNLETDTNRNAKVYARGVKAIRSPPPRRCGRGLFGGPEEERTHSRGCEKVADFVVNAASETRRRNRLSKSKEDWRGSARERSGGRGALWLSGDRG